jgi:ribosome-binding ATPase YchF (GTP1/OBG family)
VLHRDFTKEKTMQEERKAQYEHFKRVNPVVADGAKRFIYTQEKEKDDYDIIRTFQVCRKPLKYIAASSDTFFDEELEDLRYLFRSQLGKKTFKKLAKIFTLK